MIIKFYFFRKSIFEHPLFIKNDRPRASHIPITKCNESKMKMCYFLYKNPDKNNKNED